MGRVFNLAEEEGTVAGRVIHDFTHHRRAKMR